MYHLSSVPQKVVRLIPCPHLAYYNRGHCHRAFFTRIINHKIRRVRSGFLPEITEQDCFNQMNILSDVLLPELDDAPFVMDHGDLSAQNILIDSEHNVTG